MNHLRQHWEGASLPGDFILEQCLGDGEDAAFFQTSTPDGRRAVAKLVPEAAVDGKAQLDLWQAIRRLRHPNLLELYDCGRAHHGGEAVLFAVFESPDDTLASALAHAPLNRQESREVLDSVLNALRYLHAEGFAAGVLDPDHILAVGDLIKVSTDALRRALDPSAPAEDIRRLGDLWMRSLMPASPRCAEIAGHAADPNPRTRWTLDQISAALVAPPAPPVPTLPDRAAEPRIPYHFPKWILVGAAGVLLLILALNLRRPAEVDPPPAATPVSAPAVPPASKPESKPSPLAPSTAPKAVWRVIAFTYRTHEAAGRKVLQLNEFHPDLHATVFSPHAGEHLVALGGPMTHDDAVRLQHTARGKGLPRDLYVQNFPPSRP